MRERSNRGSSLLSKIPPNAIYHAIQQLADGTKLDIEIYDEFDTYKTDSVGVLAYLLYTEFSRILYLLGTPEMRYEEVDYWPGDIDIDMTLASGALLRGHVIGAHPIITYDTPFHRLIAYTFVALWSLPEFRLVKDILPQPKQAPLERFGYTEKDVKSWVFNREDVIIDLQFYMEMPEYAAYHVVFRLCELILRSLRERDSGSNFGFDSDKFIEILFEGYLRSQIYRFLSHTSNKEKIEGFTSDEFLFKRSRVQLGYKLGDHTHVEIPDILFMRKPERKTEYLIIVDSKTSQDIDDVQYREDTWQVRDYLENAVRRYKTVKKAVGVVFYFAFDGTDNSLEKNKKYGSRCWLNVNGTDYYIFGVVCRLRLNMSNGEVENVMDSSVRSMIEKLIMNDNLEKLYAE